MCARKRNIIRQFHACMYIVAGYAKKMGNKNYYVYNTLRYRSREVEIIIILIVLFKCVCILSCIIAYSTKTA